MYSFICKCETPWCSIKALTFNLFLHYYLNVFFQWGYRMKSIFFRSPFKWSVLQNNLYNCVLLLPLAPKTGYSQGATPYTQTQQTRQVTTIKPANPSPATSTFSIYPVSSAVQPAAAASVLPSYSQSPTYSTNAVTYSGKNIMLLFKGICGFSWFSDCLSDIMKCILSPGDTKFSFRIVTNYFRK